MCNQKKVVNMTEWELYVYDEEYNLSGIVDNHPSHGKNVYVRGTSSLVSYVYKNDVLTYETRNTIYVCPLKYMSTRPYENVVISYKEELTRRTEKSDSILDKLIEASAKISLIWDIEHPTERGFWDDEKMTITDAEALRDDYVNHILEAQEIGQKEIQAANAALNQQLIEMAKKYENCIYIEVSNVECGNRLAYHIGEYTGVIEPSIHTGMFQDSILYMEYGSEDDDFSLDFRYSPRGMGDIIDTYVWSDNIEQAVIKNDCHFTIEFDHENIEIGETKIFTKTTHSQGLMNLDWFNG